MRETLKVLASFTVCTWMIVHTCLHRRERDRDRETERETEREREERNQIIKFHGLEGGK